MATKSKTKMAGAKAVVKGLNQLLADSYALMGITHHAHWNVEGAGFFALHAAFEGQYNELFTAVDELAERVRVLDSYAVGGLKGLAEMSGIKEFATGRLFEKDYVRGLLSGHEKTLRARLKSRLNIKRRCTSDHYADISSGCERRIQVTSQTRNGECSNL